VTIVEENGGTRGYAYDAERPMNRVAETDPNGLTTRYQHDAAGNVTRITQPDGNRIEYHDHTAYHQPRRIKDARGHWTLLHYDARGNLTDHVRLRPGVIPTAGVSPAAGDVLSWTKTRHDAHGNHTGVKRLSGFDAALGQFDSGAGPIVTTDYDAQRLYPTGITRVGDLDGDGVADAADSTTLTYDAQGRMTRGIDGAWHVVERRYDPADRVIRATDALGHWRDHEHDANGNPTEQRLILDGRRQDGHAIGYDGADRRVLALDAGGNATRHTDALGQTRRYTWSRGHQLMERVAQRADGTQYERLRYGRNALGQILWRGAAAPAKATHVYDGAHRLVSQSHPELGVTLDYIWSPGGLLNRLQDNHGQRTDYLYDGVGRLIGIWAPNDDYIAYVHDAGGRLIERWSANGVSTRHEYTADGRLARVDNHLGAHRISRHDYQHDALGRRVRQSDTLGALGTRHWRHDYDARSRLTAVSRCADAAGRVNNPGAFSEGDLQFLYETYGPDRFSLSDRGYITQIHPLELWLVGYLRTHPKATWSDIVRESADERVEVYDWLLKTRHKNAQDSRILSLLELEAFQEIHTRWRRLGYPFGSLVPSYATAIGSSADRPAALAELMGVIANNGVKLPPVTLTRLEFAADTPYHTVLRRTRPEGERIFPEEVGVVLKQALGDVVRGGTARRLRGTFPLDQGGHLELGGKTGTGDHRFEVYSAAGKVLESRVMNRTATFAFYLGARFFGVMTVFVPGEAAADYRFTSAIAVQVLKVMEPALRPLVIGQEPREPDWAEQVAAFEAEPTGMPPRALPLPPAGASTPVAATPPPTAPPVVAAPVPAPSKPAPPAKPVVKPAAKPVNEDAAGEPPPAPPPPQVDKPDPPPPPPAAPPTPPPQSTRGRKPSPWKPGGGEGEGHNFFQ